MLQQQKTKPTQTKLPAVLLWYTPSNAELFQQGCLTDDLTFTALLSSCGEKPQPSD